MAFASGGPGAHPGGFVNPGAQSAAGGAFGAAQNSWMNLLNVAGQALQQIGVPQLFGSGFPARGMMGGSMMGGGQLGGLPPAMLQMIAPYLQGRF
jgi:hypothetical protein